jgi:hypothetical protein
MSKDLKQKSTKQKTERTSRISKSGKFRNLRHLVETLVAADKNISKEKVDAAVKKEFPDSAYITNSSGSHWPWYKCHIITKGHFTQIDTPSWAKGLDKKPKKLKTDIKEKINKKKDKVVEKVKTLIKKFKNEDKVKKKKSKHDNIDASTEHEDIDDSIKLSKPKKKKLITKEVEPSNEQLSQLEMEDQLEMEEGEN